MGLFNKLVLNLLGTKGQKIYSQFGDVIVNTIKEFNSLNEFPITNILRGWLVSFPWAYFETLFTKKDGRNDLLVDFFDKSQINNGKECAIISQAFGLFMLSNLTENDENYKKLKIENILNWIENNLKSGSLILTQFHSFKDSSQNGHPEDWYLNYIYEILRVSNVNDDYKSFMNKYIFYNPQFTLYIMTISIEMIKSAKQTIDY
jgi:hypothetical protein